MNAPNENSATKRLREWWLSPPRSGMQRLVAPYEYRHLRAFGVTRVTGGGLAAAAGVVCLSHEAYAWAAFFLVIGALNLAGGYWYLTITHSKNQTTALRPQP
jgi:O-antigen/teichoic acid export membrane protein